MTKQELKKIKEIKENSKVYIVKIPDIRIPMQPLAYCSIEQVNFLYLGKGFFDIDYVYYSRNHKKNRYSRKIKPDFVFSTRKEAEQYLLKQKQKMYEDDLEIIKQRKQEAIKFLKSYNKYASYRNDQINKIKQLIN